MIEGPKELKDVTYPECTATCYLYRSFPKELTDERHQTCIYYCEHKFIKEKEITKYHKIKVEISSGVFWQKVYCNECKHLHYCLDTFSFYCYHPDNYTKKGNWKDRNALIGVKEPSEINKDNDCKWFEKNEE
jgi:hypothetical protein